MKLEVGKTYISDQNIKYKILAEEDDMFVGFVGLLPGMKDFRLRWFRRDGSVLRNDGSETNHHLVSEYKIPITHKRHLIWYRSNLSNKSDLQTASFLNKELAGNWVRIYRGAIIVVHEEEISCTEII